MNTLKKFLNWFTNNDLRDDVKQLEGIIYSGDDIWESEGLIEQVDNLQSDVRRIQEVILDMMKTDKVKKTKTKKSK